MNAKSATVRLDQEVLSAGRKVARADHRTFSGYVAHLIERDLSSRNPEALKFSRRQRAEKKEEK